MATYGYSAGYQGGGPQPVAPGYIDAYAQAGRSIGAGMQSIGSAIGSALQRYGENKAENEFLTQRLESLAPYLQSMAQTGNVMDERSPESKLLSDIEKFSSMSIPQKKATLLNAEFYLDRMDKARAREMQDIQAEAARFNLQTAQDAEERRIREQNILSGAIRYATEQPMTTTQMQPVTETIEFPPMPGTPTPAVQATPSQAEATAARYFMGRYGQAAQQLGQYGADLGRQAAQLNVSPQPQVSYPPVFPFPGRPAPLRTESPIEAAARVEANRRLQSGLSEQSAAALQQAEIMARSPALQTVGPRTLMPEQQAQPIQQPPETRTRNVPTEVPISYEDQSKRLTQYLIQQGARPETIAQVPQILSMVGQRKPIQVDTQTLPGGITVVRADGKVDILPAPKMVEGKDLTEGQANSLGFASRMMLNEGTINDVVGRGYRPGGLTEFGFTPERLKSDDRKIYEAAKENWIAAALRKESGAAIGKDEYSAADRQYFPQPGDSDKVLKQKANLRSTVFKSMKAGIGRFADDYLRQIGAEGQPAQGQGGVRRYNPVTKRIE